MAAIHSGHKTVVVVVVATAAEPAGMLMAVVAVVAAIAFVEVAATVTAFYPHHAALEGPGTFG